MKFFITLFFSLMALASAAAIAPEIEHAKRQLENITFDNDVEIFSSNENSELTKLVIFVDGSLEGTLEETEEHGRKYPISPIPNLNFFLGRKAVKLTEVKQQSRRSTRKATKSQSKTSSTATTTKTRRRSAGSASSFALRACSVPLSDAGASVPGRFSTVLA